MAFSSGTSAGAPMCDINTTPLVDVMLVLLIIFMITAPSVVNRTDAKVPMRGPTQPDNPKPPLIMTVDVQASASRTPTLALEGVPISPNELLAKLKLESAKAPDAKPEINIRTDPNASYEHMAQALAIIKRSGAEKIRFDELNPAGLLEKSAAAAAAPQ
jgi:biopolymer transport protein ExbD